MKTVAMIVMVDLHQGESKRSLPRPLPPLLPPPRPPLRLRHRRHRPPLLVVAEGRKRVDLLVLVLVVMVAMVVQHLEPLRKVFSASSSIPTASLR